MCNYDTKCVVGGSGRYLPQQVPDPTRRVSATRRHVNIALARTPGRHAYLLVLVQLLANTLTHPDPGQTSVKLGVGGKARVSWKGVRRPVYSCLVLHGARPLLRCYVHCACAADGDASLATAQPHATAGAWRLVAMCLNRDHQIRACWGR